MREVWQARGMPNDPERLRHVGSMLAARRDDLDLRQSDLAAYLDIAARSVSAVERGEHGIRRGTRHKWEEGLQLVRGTINAAYANGSALDPLAVPAHLGDGPFSDAEWAIYTCNEPGLGDAGRRRLVNYFREQMGRSRRRTWPLDPWTHPDRQRQGPPERDRAPTATDLDANQAET